MKKIILSAASLAVAAVASVSVAPTTSEAVPAFARQTGAACLNCHFQAIPRLGQMAREFRAGGFTDASVDLIEDEHLSLPAYFGASVLFKARVGFGDDNNLWNSGSSSAFQYPDEAALLMGGRLGENTGALVEWNGGPLSYKLIHMIDAGEMSVGLIMASTDALGAAYAFNDPSNALIRNTRGSQFRPGFLKNSSIQDAVSGYGVTLDGEMFHVSLAQFIRNMGTNINDPAMPFGKGLIYFSAAFIGDVAGFDTVAGIYSVSGTQSTRNGVPGGAIADYSETTTGIDVQMQGELGDALAGLYFVYQMAGEQKNGTTVAADYQGFNLLGTYSLNHSTLVKVGYAAEEDKTSGATTNTAVLGLVYDVAQNFAIDIEHNAVTKNSGAPGAADVSTGQTTVLFEYVF